MRNVFASLGAAIFAAISVSGAVAQNGGYVIQSPGQSPRNVNPTPGGGYVIQTPGQVPTNVNPTPGGGYVIQTPGQPPTNVTPLPGGGFRSQTPCLGSRC